MYDRIEQIEFLLSLNEGRSQTELDNLYDELEELYNKVNTLKEFKNLIEAKRYFLDKGFSLSKIAFGKYKAENGKETWEIETTKVLTKAQRIV